MIGKTKVVLFGVILVLVLLLFFYFCGYNHVLRKVNTSENILYLTFDDGPGPHADEILDILKARNVTATFFLVGKEAKQSPEIVRRMVLEGHVVGTHSYSHSYLITHVTEEVLLGKVAVSFASQEPVTLFRAPYGFLLPWTLKRAKQFDLQVVSWSCFPRDYKASKEKIVARVTHCITPGAIIVLHDGYQNQTIQVLPEIIASARDEGYTFGVLGT